MQFFPECLAASVGIACGLGGLLLGFAVSIGLLLRRKGIHPGGISPLRPVLPQTAKEESLPVLSRQSHSPGDVRGLASAAVAPTRPILKHGLSRASTMSETAADRRTTISYLLPPSSTLQSRDSHSKLIAAPSAAQASASATSTTPPSPSMEFVSLRRPTLPRPPSRWIYRGAFNDASVRTRLLTAPISSDQSAAAAVPATLVPHDAQHYNDVLQSASDLSTIAPDEGLLTHLQEACPWVLNDTSCSTSPPAEPGQDTVIAPAQGTDPTFYSTAAQRHSVATAQSELSACSAQGNGQRSNNLQYGSEIYVGECSLDEQGSMMSTVVPDVDSSLDASPGHSMDGGLQRRARHRRTALPLRVGRLRAAGRTDAVSLDSTQALLDQIHSTSSASVLPWQQRSHQRRSADWPKCDVEHQPEGAPYVFV